MARTDARVKLLDAALVAAVMQGAAVFGGDFKRWCELNQIPRSTAYRHKKRIEEEGRWATRSQRPRSCPHHTPEAVEAEVVGLRTSLGRENGADNIGYHLAQIAAEQGWAGHG